MRKTKIVCTMGPACESIEILKDMIRAGMNVARLNMAHGDLEYHKTKILAVRQAAFELEAVVSVMMDIKGPEIRTCLLEEPSYELVTGDNLILTSEQVLGTKERIAVNYPDLPKDIYPGARILLDDGLIELLVEKVEGEDISCRIVNGGVIKPRKGVNLPGICTSLPGVTERDIMHIQFGIEQGIDIIAPSFVRKAEDIMQIREILEEKGAGHIQIISKIENQEGVDNLNAIIEVSDGIMVARGDLGVEIPAEEVPLVQKDMIRKCNQAGKAVIVATQMLDSMQVNPRPTRAEVSDVANAIMDGTDAIMLSGESAAGRYPLLSVQTMARIAEKTESSMDYKEQFTTRRTAQKTDITEVISQAVVSSSFELNAKAILTSTASGFTARMISKYRPEAPIIAVTPDKNVLHRLTLTWGVTPIHGENHKSIDDMLASTTRLAEKTGLVSKGDLVVISAGVPFAEAGTTNFLKIQEV